jgi:hypothetical protein
MIERINFSAMAPAKRADLILSAAQSDLTRSLWRAALGVADVAAPQTGPKASTATGFENLIALLMPEEPAPSPQTSRQTAATQPTNAAAPLALGANAAHAPAIQSAAARTGVPAPALAAIIDAEAAKGPDGSWRTMSRNPRSSAAGLGQFLSSTWIAEAERAGTWLNARAMEKGWIDGNGRIVPAARAALLQLRYEAEAAVEATADYAANSLKGLRRAGVAIGDTVESIARSAYLGHHLGLGDATRFLKSGLSDARARTLLGAQVGITAAIGRIAEAGDAASAHRAWLGGYLDRKIRPGRFVG